MNDRKKRIRELQLKSNRKNFKKNFESTTYNLFLEDFLNIDETKKLQDEVFRKVDSSQNEKIPKGPENSRRALLPFQNILQEKEEDTVVVFHELDSKIGAICVNLKGVYSNLDSLLKIIGHASDNQDFILIGTKLEFGIVIERTEYENIFSYWGL